LIAGLLPELPAGAAVPRASGSLVWLWAESQWLPAVLLLSCLSLVLFVSYIF
jgi:hypothetical protein